MKKNLLKHLLLLIVALGCWATVAAHDFEVVNDDGVTIYYNVTDSENKTVEVTFCGNTYDEYHYEYGGYVDGGYVDVVIPEEVTYNSVTYRVTSIGDEALRDCDGFYGSLTIPNSVTSIGDSAFDNCTSLQSIVIPASVTSMDNCAFAGCLSLKSVHISDIAAWCNIDFVGRSSNPMSAGYYDPPCIYLNGEEITEVEISETLTIIKPLSFLNWRQLKSVTIPNSVTEIGGEAFYGCTGLTEITIPNSVTEIGGNTFEGCTGLSEITIPNSVTEIGRGVFEGCSGLTEITIPNSVTKIGDQAFTGCSGLTEITIPKSVTEIGASAFEGCSGLTEITIPNSVTSIGGAAFANCSGLTEITIPNSVTEIGSGVFYGCSGLTEITIPNSVTEIGRFVFYGCSGLTEITIPNSVTKIGDQAFTGCSGLTEITIPKSVTEIGASAFEGCSGLTEITIPNSVTSIGEFAFYNCYFTTVNLPGIEWFFSIKLDSTHQDLFNAEIFFDGKRLRHLTIPESVDNFSQLPFLYPVLESLNTGNTMTEIPENHIDAGVGVEVNIKQLTIGKNIRKVNANFADVTTVISHAATPPTITQETFPKCSFDEGEGIVILDSPDVLKKYEKANVWRDMQMSDMSNEAEVTVDTPGELSFELIDDCGLMPVKVTRLKVTGGINASDFEQMRINMLSLIHLDLSEAVIEEIPANALAGKLTLQTVKLPKDCPVIGYGAFNGCGNITELTLPENLTTIEAYAFAGCSGVDELELPIDVKSIGAFAFEGLGTTQLDFNYALESIGDYAFYGSYLREITFQNRLKSIGVSAFEGCRLAQELILPDNIVSIGARAFYGQTGIVEHLTIPETVKELGAEAFAGTSIATVFIPGKLTELMPSVFADCKLLDAVHIPDNITAIGESAFMNCKTLTNVRMSQNLQSVAAYAFNSTNIRSVIVPDLMTTVAAYTYGDCLNLRSASLPATMQSLEEGAFSGCRNLLNLTVKAVTPPTVTSTTFKGVNTDKCIISIPTDSYKDYVLASYWGRFIQMRNDIAVETEGDGTITFDNGEEGEVETDSVATDEPMQARRMRLAKRAKENSITTVDNGSTIYVPKEGMVHFIITPGQGEELVSATFNGKDIIHEMIDGVFTTTASEKNGKLVVKFTGESGVDQVKADRIITDNVYYDLMGRRVENPTPGIYIHNGKKVVVK